ncbi:MAG: hypothetical protein RL095_2669 [Verrucomicrobiota bacterium]|jgi:type III pantothenate kinase
MSRKLLLSIGNTHAVLASPGLAWSRRVPTASLGEAPLDELVEPCRVLCAGVVPALRDQLARHHPDAHFRFLSAADFHGLLDLEGIRGIGMDRLCNAVAALELLPLPALVIDCGTCLTGTAVAPGGKVLGGFILPGRRLARSALASGTGQLPEVPLSSEIPKLLGEDTAAAIRSGIDLGSVEAVKGLASLAAGAGQQVFLTGGDAPWFLQNSGLSAAPAEFTLRGLDRVHHHLSQVRNAP